VSDLVLSHAGLNVPIGAYKGIPSSFIPLSGIVLKMWKYE